MHKTIVPWKFVQIQRNRDQWVAQDWHKITSCRWWKEKYENSTKKQRLGFKLLCCSSLSLFAFDSFTNIRLPIRFDILASCEWKMWLWLKDHAWKFDAIKKSERKMVVYLIWNSNQLKKYLHWTLKATVVISQQKRFFTLHNGFILTRVKFSLFN